MREEVQMMKEVDNLSKDPTEEFLNANRVPIILISKNSVKENSYKLAM